MPLEHDRRKLYEKQAQPGDLVVMAGGRVGKDGIHGATFSSEALDPQSPVTAVQIGDPITQKKFSDVIVKEARDLGLYRSITDNGAGGISCSVAEMAKECNGCHVYLDRVPLKYPGMAPWESLDLGIAGADDLSRPTGETRRVHGADAATGGRGNGDWHIYRFRQVRCRVPWQRGDGYRAGVPAQRPAEKTLERPRIRKKRIPNRIPPARNGLTQRCLRCSSGKTSAQRSSSRSSTTIRCRAAMCWARCRVLAACRQKPR